MSRSRLRLGGFIAFSFVLHILTALGTGPFDLSARGSGDARGRTELHATLAPAGSGRAEPAPSPSGDAQGAAAGNATEPPAPRGTAAAERAAEAGGLLPTVEPWYTAAEVDVRAEPVTRVNLRYPENPRAELAVSTVRLRLYIDERGVVLKIQIAEPGPSAAYDEAARRAWEEVRFRPALKNGAPVRSQKLIELTYTANSQ